MRPGFHRPSRSRTFLSVFNSGPLAPDCNLNGSERPCVNCGACARVCPVDIFPQFAFKAALADDIDETLALGLLDCAECGLCSYVCPSKIDVAGMLKDAKKQCFLEEVQP